MLTNENKTSLLLVSGVMADFGRKARIAGRKDAEAGVGDIKKHVGDGEAGGVEVEDSFIVICHSYIYCPIVKSGQKCPRCG